MRFDPFLTLHDFYVHVACQRVCHLFGAAIISADGGSMVEDNLPFECPTIFGYKPDAIGAWHEGAIFIEVKSQGDLHSTHSKKQFYLINQMLMDGPTLYLYIYVFNSNGANQIPKEFNDLVHSRITLEQS